MGNFFKHDNIKVVQALGIAEDALMHLEGYGTAFIRYSGHIGSVFFDFFEGGWKEGELPDFEAEVSLCEGQFLKPVSLRLAEFKEKIQRYIKEVTNGEDKVCFRNTNINERGA